MSQTLKNIEHTRCLIATVRTKDGKRSAFFPSLEQQRAMNELMRHAYKVVYDMPDHRIDEYLEPDGLH